MNKTTVLGLTQGIVSFPQFAFMRIRDGRHVSKNRVLDMGVEIVNLKTDEREYSVSYWNNLRDPSDTKRVFKNKEKAIKFYDRAYNILIDTPEIRKLREK